MRWSLRPIARDEMCLQFNNNNNDDDDDDNNNNNNNSKYTARKIRTNSDQDAGCRMCCKGQETIAHVLSGCSAPAKTKYLTRHNTALKFLFLDMAKDYLHSPAQPKPVCENDQITAH